MWTRAQLKERAKTCMHRNYWKTVFISFIFSLLISGGYAYSYTSSGSTDTKDIEYIFSGGDVDEEKIDGYEFGSEYDDEYVEDMDNLLDDSSEIESEGTVAIVVMVLVFLVVFLVVFVIVMAITLVLVGLIFGPLEVGAKRFFVRNLYEKAEAKEIMFGFDHSYKNVAWTMFFMNLYIALWTLLFIIPGIIKAYEYMLVPYMLAENPQMDRNVAFAESKRLMKGNKWKAFVLELSFLGWNILSLLTLGLLGIFYVDPYMNMTYAAFYEAVRYGGPRQPIYYSNPNVPTPNYTPNNMGNGQQGYAPNNMQPPYMQG